MAHLQWALTCRDFTIDATSNNITYRDAIEQISSVEYPAPLPENMITVAMMWRRDDIEVPEEFKCRIVLEDDEGEPAVKTDAIEVDLVQYERSRVHVSNPGVQIEEPSTIWFLIQKNDGDGWEECWSLPVEMREIEEDEPEA